MVFAMPKRLDRRIFLQATAAAAAASTLPSCEGTKAGWRFFTDEEGKTVEAICDQIIPEDQDPGAARAGSAHYIDIQLVGAYRDHRETYRTALAGVDQSSAALCGKRFVDLAADEKVRVLTALENDQAPGEAWKGLPARQFFALIVDHTMQGFYGDPRHGGNKDGMSWKMLALPQPPVLGHDMGPPRHGKGQG
jgi:gluconate 2-dehydrogenase gamma chain